VGDPQTRRALFERLIRSDLLEIIRRDGGVAADAHIEAILRGAGSGAAPGGS
jgi:hypothetical protein